MKSLKNFKFGWIIHNVDLKKGTNSQFSGQINIKASPPICAVYLEYIVTIHFVHSYTNLLTLYVQYTKTLAVKKWLPFELICAVGLEDIVTIHFVRLYTLLLTLYGQYTKTLAVKKWLPFELICAVDLEYIVTIHFVCPCPNLLTLYVQ